MKSNVFETKKADGSTISHDDIAAVFKDVKMYGSLRDSVIAHGLIDEIDAIAHEDEETPSLPTYGISNIGYLFPEARNYTNTPGFINNTPDEWVGIVMNGVHKTPFSRVRTMFADITADDARAKGYIKGNEKIEEVFGLLKRETVPTTIYKKQKLDRDDIADITSFDIVSWLKSEMRMKLDEEIARAILIGDGRSSVSNDKINPQNIRPILYDDELFTVRVDVAENTYNDELLEDSSVDPEAAAARKLINSIVRSRKLYKGSGRPIMFCSYDTLTSMRLIEDKNLRIVYDSDEKLANALGVSRIIPVPYMSELVYDNPLDDEDDFNDTVVHAIIVNLNDYNVGTDRGGQVSMFDDFDIDYNQQKYLMETRMSGAMVKPYAAIAICETPSESSGNE